MREGIQGNDALNASQVGDLYSVYVVGAQVREKRPLRGAKAVRNGSWRAGWEQITGGAAPKETAPKGKENYERPTPAPAS